MVQSLCYECTCTSNSSSPALQYYTETMPTFQCQQVFINCILESEDDAAAQKKCTDIERVNCGHIDPDSIDFVTSTSSSPQISAASTYFSSSKPTSSTPYQISTSSEASTGNEQITSTTKTITPTPTGTTTVWSTSTAGVNVNGTRGAGSTSGNANSSSLPGITDSGATSTSPGSTDAKTSSTSTGVPVKPSTVSTSGAERMRGGGLSRVWRVLVVGIVGFRVMGF
ncbi:hypothetical protein NHQ30_006409 [Ciborinia camelliae]|nr:hypothetical protein NHQ30_006409 [Ciborinia camelliae]